MNYPNEKRIHDLIMLEWKAFDEVINEGGRASCQDDWYTFNLMRKSQYLAWTDEMIASYTQDFYEANEMGWNLITEKYGRMEKSTCPEKWEQIKDYFPQIPEEKQIIIDNIVGLQVAMMEEFAQEFPEAAGNARVIHTSEDTPYQTSYETYLRAEISTYSDTTLKLYGHHLAELAASGKNLAKMIIRNTALLGSISPATPWDKAEILALYKMQLGRDFCAWNEFYPEMEDVESDIERKASFVMRDSEGKIIAAIAIDADPVVDKLECWSKDLYPGAELSRLAVSPDYQNQGIARMMICYMFDVLRERGFKSAHYMVYPKNLLAVNSYAKLNFNKVGETDYYEHHYDCYELEL